MSENKYLLLSAAEKARLQLQARVWEAEAEAVFDAVNIAPGWACLDIGCGAMGVLGPLSRRVGADGRVAGIEMDPDLLSAARQYVEDEKLTNIELFQGDAHKSNFSPESFDLVHERFVFPHVPYPEALLKKMIALTKPGGVVLLQEPDHSSWNFWPPCPAWQPLLKILEATLALRGDINIGRRTFHMAMEAGLENVTIRAAVIALQHSHPYMKMPLVAAAAMRPHILSTGLATAAELDELLGAVEVHTAVANTIMITFTVTQVWGQKPVNI